MSDERPNGGEDGGFDLAVAIRRNRERLKLSHARLAELVGRSPSVVRSWERGNSAPTDPKVLQSLAAVLGLDESQVLAAAGNRGASRTSRPTAESTPEPDDMPDDVTSSRRGAHSRDEPVSVPSVGEAVGPLVDRVRSLVTDMQSRRLQRSQTSSSPPVGARPLSTLPQRPPTPSYVELEQERMAYRLRSLLTTVGVVLALMVVVWAGGHLLDALGQTWGALTANL